MRKRGTIKNILLVFLILVFVISPIKFDGFDLRNSKVEGANLLIITTDTIWRKSDNVVVDKNVLIDNGATLTIEKGATITFKGEPRLITIFNGKIIAEGTKDEKITLRTDQTDWSTYGIIFQDRNINNLSFFRYVRFLNGGFYPCVTHNNKSNNFLNTAYACPIGGAIEYYSGKVHIENSEFVDSFEGAVYADIYEHDGEKYHDGSYLEIINSNFSGSGSKIAASISVLCDAEDCKTKTTLKNNWYGDGSGPSSGERVLGNVGYDGHRKNDLVADPVIVIPGITGSMPSKILAGKLVLDPILHVYDNLIASMEENGYEKDENLFNFPYEWRNSNTITASDLKIKINEIKTDTKISKVDIVAHSMGGLLARQYIENSGYQNDIDQLITLGTPHKGAPKAYMQWEAGEAGIQFEDKIIASLFSVEAHTLGYNNLQDYIQSRVISVKELLPDYDYLQKNENMINYPAGYPRNEFLEVLNSPSSINNLAKVNFYNIIGNTDSEKTINKFRVVNSTVSGSWEHGMPENFYDESTDQGIEYGSGDKTVPFASSNGIAANKKTEIDSVHSDLPTKAQCYIFKELAGKVNCQYISTFARVKNILTFGVFSPIDIQVIAPNGQWIGKNISGLNANNEIPGAYYSGYDTESEFLTIPNPLDGEYKIITEGTDNGSYKIEAAKISENENNLGVGSTAEIFGIATLGKRDELKVEVVGDEIIAGNQDKTPPTIKVTSPENKTYQNNEILEIGYTISDDVSAIDKIKKELFYDGNVTTADKTDLSLEHLGMHNISVKAIDEAGNIGEGKIEFTSSTNIKSIISNVDHYFDLHLITSIGTRNYLRVKSQLIKGEMQVIDELEKTKLPKFAKEKLLGMFKKIVNQEINHLIIQIQKEKNLAKTITPKVRELLVESLEEIRL